MSSSLSRRRLDPNLQPSTPQAGTIATLFSLLLLGAVVTAVALFVLRTSPTTFMAASHVDPVGTTIAAPDVHVAPPTLIPTVAPGQSTKGPGGQIEAIAMLPTVAPPPQQPAQVAQPTPTPRAVVLPTVIPMTLPLPAATRPPSQPVSSQPVAAFVMGHDPSEPLAATAPQPSGVANQSEGSTSVAPTQISSPQDNAQRALAMQENRVRRGSDRSHRSVHNAQTAMPAPGQSDAQSAAVPDTQNSLINAVSQHVGLGARRQRHSSRRRRSHQRSAPLIEPASTTQRRHSRPG